MSGPAKLTLKRKATDLPPDTLIVVDGVCSVGSEDLRFDEWGLDVVVSASQKALGAPAGLSILMASSRAIQAFENRRTPPSAYYVSWSKWLPIMRSYESEGRPLYFATPSTHLIRALHASLTGILSCSLTGRFQQHRETSRLVKDAVARLGLAQVAPNAEDQSHAMTAFRLPKGVIAADVLPALAKEGVVLARGPQKEIAGQYIRFAHMGVSVTEREGQDIQKGITSLYEVFAKVQKQN